MTNPSEEIQKENRLALIRQALQNKAPVMYGELESSGKLQMFLDAHDAEMMASYNEAKKAAWQETMDTFLNFSDTACDETSSPM